jgi:hypothetical protein
MEATIYSAPCSELIMSAEIKAADWTGFRVQSMNINAIYDEVRRQARKAAQDDLQEQISSGLFDYDGASYRDIQLAIGPIDENALDAWAAFWDGHADRRYEWDWRFERSSWQTTLRRADAAIWANGELCGLLIGMATKGRTFLRVDLLEGSPNLNHPLKGRIAYCATEIAEAFGFAFGCGKVSLMRPVDEAVPLYQELGFELLTTKADIPHCVRRIE